jgi:hypothetical protein
MCPPQVAALPAGAILILTATAGGSAALAAFLLAHLLALIAIMTVCSGYLTTVCTLMARHYRRHPAWARIAKAKARAIEQAAQLAAIEARPVLAIEPSRPGPVYGMSQLADGTWVDSRVAGLMGKA